MVNEILKLILKGYERRPAPAMSWRLDALFRALLDPAAAEDPDDIQAMIWALWCEHPDPEAARSLSRAADAMVAGRLVVAESMLDRTVLRWPDFAEAWNKRATLYYMQDRDQESMSDIRTALELEPRHFGAICGFGQICMRRGDRMAALAAFETALRLNPHLANVRQMVEALAEDLPRTVN
ncbi:hypothetical protein GCM10011505_26740 [Tistrella bauzanensis]|uniref:Tetratricopeptide repeat protein n=1 Tax=Tistrella bauzanensis TaxID=657419 RepID=A0ABQ1IJG0_9PROT|nr:tetratricopeptide repeat protein [Tistrella bauzanensis]GGB44061.1 hypothetical protein GCM10011505_26740 [Tistrella bauzanensis]